MTFRSFTKLGFAAAAVLCTSSIAFADGTITVQGTKTNFAPDRFIGLSYDVKSPRDIATGQASGRRQHGQLCVHKTAGSTTVQWFTAVTTNEVLKTVTLESPSLRYKLSNAFVSELRLTTAPDGKELEEICLTFERIELTHLKGGATGGDNWR
jgi:type VI secretion system secreted protein Hcp